MRTFGEVRKPVIARWLKETNRKRHINSHNDLIYDAYECDWQDDYAENHSSIYCGLGEWNSHITDFLIDNRFDNLTFSRESYRRSLFRHYSRLLLVVSEVITDFIDLMNYLKITDPKIKLRSNSPAPFTITELLAFINNKCKHKIGKVGLQNIHCFNHHSPYFFSDSLKRNYHKSSIKVFKLQDIIDTVLNCYQVFDNILKQDYRILKTLLSKFEKKI